MGMGDVGVWVGVFDRDATFSNIVLDVGDIIGKGSVHSVVDFQGE